MTNIGAVLPCVYACAGARPGRTARPCRVLKASARRAGRSQGRLRSRARSESRMAVRLGTADGVERKHAPSTPSSACEHKAPGGGRPGEAAASGRVQSVALPWKRMSTRVCCRWLCDDSWCEQRPRCTCRSRSRSFRCAKRSAKQSSNSSTRMWW